MRNIAIAKAVGIAFVVAEIVLVKYLTTKSSGWFQPKDVAPAA
jgi:hypothetical protein